MFTLLCVSFFHLLSQLKMQHSTGYKIDIMVEVASAEDIEKYARCVFAFIMYESALCNE